jgi:transcriptional regulator with XRE-family HTH domain
VEAVTNPKPDTFASKLRTLRESRNMTREELADAIGTSRQRIHLLETSKHRPRWDEVQEIAKALGVALNDLADS